MYSPHRTYTRSNTLDDLTLPFSLHKITEIVPTVVFTFPDA